MDMLAYFLGRLAGNGGGASSDEEINDFITQLPDNLEDINGSIAGENTSTDWYSGESAFFENDDGEIIALCDNDVWNLSLETMYFLTITINNRNTFIRGLYLEERTSPSGEKYRYIEAGLSALKFFKKDIHGDTYVTYDGKVNVGDTIKILFMEA
jgi:hypothetical protein